MPSIQTMGIIAAGAIGLVLLLALWFLYSEVQDANKTIGEMSITLQTFEQANKDNLKAFLESNEFQGLVDSMRVDREALVREIAQGLDTHLTDYGRAVQEDTEVKDWDQMLVPSWIRQRNQGGQNATQ